MENRVENVPLFHCTVIDVQVISHHSMKLEIDELIQFFRLVKIAFQSDSNSLSS